MCIILKLSGNFDLTFFAKWLVKSDSGENKNVLALQYERGKMEKSHNVDSRLLFDALHNSFNARTLKELLFRTGYCMQDVPSTGRFNTDLLDIVIQAEQNEKLRELLQGAINMRPHNTQLYTLAQKHDIVPYSGGRRTGRPSLNLSWGYLIYSSTFFIMGLVIATLVMIIQYHPENSLLKHITPVASKSVTVVDNDVRIPTSNTTAFIALPEPTASHPKSDVVQLFSTSTPEKQSELIEDSTPEQPASAVSAVSYVQATSHTPSLQVVSYEQMIPSAHSALSAQSEPSLRVVTGDDSIQSQSMLTALSPSSSSKMSKLTEQVVLSPTEASLIVVQQKKATATPNTTQLQPCTSNTWNNEDVIMKRASPTPHCLLKNR